nr:uncharacterized protein LOC109179728 [Ipomoea trifida]GMD44196.1 nuclear poly(A) polymerase 2-like isoform X1 [Ipomoea batatas]
MTELLQLNWPPPPLIDLPNQGERSQMPESGKEPAVQNQLENPEIVVGDEGLEQNTSLMICIGLREEAIS